VPDAGTKSLGAWPHFRIRAQMVHAMLHRRYELERSYLPSLII
jgi:hypothetical protein